MRLIDADELIDILNAWKDEARKREAEINEMFASAVIAQVMQQPTIEPEKRWIPVTERLPKVGKTVICQCRADILKLLKLDSGGDWYQDAEHAYMSGFVLAWMPMPEAYKGGEEDGN